MDSKKNGGLGLDGKDMIVGGAGLTLGTIAAARYGNKAIGGLANKLLRSGGSLSLGVAEGKALEAAAGVTPVFITNWPATLGGLVPQTGPIPKTATAGYGAAAVNLLKKPGLAAIAGVIAGWGGSKLDKLLGGTGDYLEPGTFPGESGPRHNQVKNDIKIDIQIDDRGRVITKTTGMNNSVNTMKRGSFFDAITAMPAGY